jgi:hypothetical protein
MLTFLILMFAFLGYLIFIIIHIVVTKNDVEIVDGVEEEKDPYKYSRGFLLFFIGATLVISLASFIYSILCYFAFGKGLLEQRQQYKLGAAVPPADATTEQAIRISMIDPFGASRRQEVLD